MRTAVAVALMLLAGTVSAQSVPQPSVALPVELARVLRDYEAAWSAMDATALANLFVEDGFVLSNGHEAVRGRAAVETFYRRQGGPLVLRPFAFGMDEQVGYIVGGFAAMAGQPDIGKFTLTLRKDGDGRWLIVSDMDNSNRRRD
jgi:ketosteroid isomerase-like protein